MTQPRYLAIPTEYAGVRFRSTLEADWACTLDHYGIAWEYEPEGVRLPDGTRYLPDFYLPELATWLEVKGPHDERLDKARRFAKAVEWPPDLHGWHGPDKPWRLVVIGRPSQYGGMVATTARGAPIDFARCGCCGVYSFLPGSGECRQCGMLVARGGGAVPFWRVRDEVAPVGLVRARARPPERVMVVSRDLRDTDVALVIDPNTGELVRFRDGVPKLVLKVPVNLPDASSTTWCCTGRHREHLTPAIRAAGVPHDHPEAGSLILVRRDRETYDIRYWRAGPEAQAMAAERGITYPLTECLPTSTGPTNERT